MLGANFVGWGKRRGNLRGSGALVHCLQHCTGASRLFFCSRPSPLFPCAAPCRGLPALFGCDTSVHAKHQLRSQSVLREAARGVLGMSAEEVDERAYNKCVALRLLSSWVVLRSSLAACSLAAWLQCQAACFPNCLLP